jgi:hypothetical protein
LFSADAYENFAKSVPFFRMLFMPRRVKFNPSEIVFVNLYGATYHEKIDVPSEKYESPENNLRVNFLKKCYLFTVNDNYLDVLNENDPKDFCKRTYYIPFIERIWIYKYKFNFSTVSKNLKILYHNKEENFLDLKSTFSTMSEDDINGIINFLLRHQPLLKVGYNFWGG